VRPGEAITVVTFLCFILLGWLLRLSWRQQRQIIVLALVGSAPILGARMISMRLPATARVIDDWLPTFLILFVYWQSGRFYTNTNAKLQEWLDGFDRRWLGDLIRRWECGWRTSWLGIYLEVAYLFCSPLVLLGVAVLYFAHLRTKIDIFWITVLTPTYLCYLALPWTATLPPRLTHPSPAARTKLQRLNKFILGRAGIQLNTFPSAHVASSLSVSMVLLHVIPAVGVIFLIVAVSIAAAAFLGRYHYMPDILLGALLAMAVSFATLH